MPINALAAALLHCSEQPLWWRRRAQPLETSLTWLSLLGSTYPDLGRIALGAEGYAALYLGSTLLAKVVHLSKLQERRRRVHRQSKQFEVDGQILLGILANGLHQMPCLHQHLVSIVVEAGIDE